MQIADKDKVIEFHCGIIYRIDRTMERIRLWRYRKLANENVKEDKVIEKQSDDEDYNSCFKLKRNLKVRVLFLSSLFTTMHLMSNRGKLSSAQSDERINY